MVPSKSVKKMTRGLVFIAGRALSEPILSDLSYPIVHSNDREVCWGGLEACEKHDELGTTLDVIPSRNAVCNIYGVAETIIDSIVLQEQFSWTLAHCSLLSNMRADRGAGSQMTTQTQGQCSDIREFTMENSRTASTPSRSRLGANSSGFLFEIWLRGVCGSWKQKKRRRHVFLCVNGRWRLAFVESGVSRLS